MPNIKFYESITGSLSNPSKMPGYGYGLPALDSCNVGSKLAKVEGTACHSCYACKGHYQFPNVRRAQQKRMQSVTNPSWVKAMVAQIGSKKEKYFRWHDSGDILDVAHLKKICEVATLLPEFKFWLPTQEHVLVGQFLKDGGVIPDNLTVRLSTPKIDSRPVKTTLPTSTIHREAAAHGTVCPAPMQGNKCGSCRNCWDKNVKNVSYRAH